LLAVSKIEPSDVAKLNGYWEIVVLTKAKTRIIALMVMIILRSARIKRDSEKSNAAIRW
jgi:hypothetical protein